MKIIDTETGPNVIVSATTTGIDLDSQYQQI
jgi:hypothetical protein